jgi:hypothetical protein
MRNKTNVEVDLTEYDPGEDFTNPLIYTAECPCCKKKIRISETQQGEGDYLLVELEGR